MQTSAHEIYETHLKRAEDRLGVDLDPQHYRKIRELELHGRDLLTAATAVSLAGLALVTDGCKDLSKINNVHKIGIGRGFDLIDGPMARAMNQASDAGAATDATIDKLEMFLIGKAAWQQNALPKSFITYVGVKNMLHVGLAAGAAYQHPKESFEPPRSGKLSMFGDNIAGGALLYANAYEHERPDLEYHQPLRRIGRDALVASGFTEAVALKTYVRRLNKDYQMNDRSKLVPTDNSVEDFTVNELMAVLARKEAA